MNNPAKKSSSSLTHLRRKTVLHLLRTWRDFKKDTRQKAVIRPSVPKEDHALLRGHMMSCLDSPGGEISQRTHTAELGRIYLNLNEEGRLVFLKLLARDFDIHRKTLTVLTDAYHKAPESEKFRLELELRETLTTPRSAILRQFTALPDGFKFLVNMRADLLPLVGDNRDLQGLEYDLKNILSAWFDIGLLDLVEITWNSPAALLEKLIEYEAVHRVTSWDDLKNRLDSDRRVFAFFHNKMPLDPLIFVHVALVKGMSDNIQQLLDEKAPAFDVEKADTAIFYSISNAQKGLAGISFGNFLIKRVVSQLTQEMPQIKTFATLSPIPGFHNWLGPVLAKGNAKLLSQNERQLLIKSLDSDWQNDKKLLEPVKSALLRLCAHYLLHEKRGDKPLDPVAAFHLFNGARLERLNWLADTSARGLKQSAGIMANYHYKLDEVDDNHENFVTHRKIVAANQVRGYLK